MQRQKGFPDFKPKELEAPWPEVGRKCWACDLISLPVLAHHIPAETPCPVAPWCPTLSAFCAPPPLSLLSTTLSSPAPSQQQLGSLALPHPHQNS